MNLKKVENKKVPWRLFQYFCKKEKSKIYFYPLNKEQKSFLIYAIIYIALDNEDSKIKVSKNYIKKIFEIFLNTNSCSDIEKIYKDNLNRTINLNGLNENLLSFYENSYTLNFFTKKIKRKSLANIKNISCNKYSLLNQNMKFILSFIKEITPKKFNYIYRKIVSLS